MPGNTQLVLNMMFHVVIYLHQIISLPFIIVFCNLHLKTSVFITWQNCSADTHSNNTFSQKLLIGHGLLDNSDF